VAKFPDQVITAMHHTGTTVTCLPVQMSPDPQKTNASATNPSDRQTDRSDWQAAMFFVLPESWENRQIKRTFRDGTLFPVGLSADLLEEDTATLVTIELEIHFSEHPLNGEILFIPGHLETHHETLRLLSEQQGIDLFIGDKFCTLLHQQTIPLSAEHREVFGDLLKEASSRDALIRFRGQYDPQAAFANRVGGRQVWMPEPPAPSDQH